MRNEERRKKKRIAARGENESLGLSQARRFSAHTKMQMKLRKWCVQNVFGFLSSPGEMSFVGKYSDKIMILPPRQVAGQWASEFEKNMCTSNYLSNTSHNVNSHTERHTY